MRHVRASVPQSRCSYDTLLSPTGTSSSNGDPEFEDWKLQSWTPRTFDVIAIRSKVITGPGLLNALTAMGQAKADSVPILVISGVGTRHYYRKLGYELDGPYMSKMLVAKQ